MHGRISAVCGRIYAYRTGRHLAYRHNIGKLARRKPPVMVHHLALNERQHAVAATETEQAYLKECYEKKQENHIELKVES